MISQQLNFLCLEAKFDMFRLQESWCITHIQLMEETCWVSINNSKQQDLFDGSFCELKVTKEAKKI